MKKIVLLSLTLLNFQLAISQSVEDAWVYFKDKQNVGTAIANPTTILTQRAIDRKIRFGIAIDSRDVPVNENYISDIKTQAGIQVYAKSKWMNAVHVRGIKTDVDKLLELSYVLKVEYADKSLNSGNRISASKDKFAVENTQEIFNYGYADNQVKMINVHKLHEINYTGDNIIVAVLDTGFPNVNTISAFARLRGNNDLLGGYDFVGRSNDIYNSNLDDHGTRVLSIMAAYIQDDYVGTAPDASYYLFRTEDTSSENPVEESYWVEAAERADSLGVDVINTSLGYFDYDDAAYNYTQNDMDGKTAYITRGATIAVEKGIFVVTSAGNSGYSVNGTISAPADAATVFTIGAVNPDETRASFSSVGSNIQPTIKPDVMAQGSSVVIVTKLGTLASGPGTSYSCPISAGAIACLMQAFPNDKPEDLRQKIRESADRANNPDYLYGYGIPDFFSVYSNLLSTEDLMSPNLIIYPNPTNDKLYIKLPSASNEIKARLYSVTGKIIYSFHFNRALNEINLSDLSQGMYFLQIEDAKGDQTFKIVKN